MEWMFLQLVNRTGDSAWYRGRFVTPFGAADEPATGVITRYSGITSAYSWSLISRIEKMEGFVPWPLTYTKVQSELGGEVLDKPGCSIGGVFPARPRMLHSSCNV